MYEILVEYSNLFNETLLEVVRFVPLLFCFVLSISVLMGGIVSLIEYIIEKVKGKKNERE